MEAKISCPLSPRPAPWIVFSHGKREKTKTFFNVSDGSYKVKNIPQMRRTRCLASCYGWLLMLDKTSGDYFLLNYVSLKKIQLPCPKLTDCVYSHILSSPPTDPDCVIMIFYYSKNSLVYCRPASDKWTEREYELEESDSVLRVAPCNGKVYAYTLHRKLGIVDVDSDPVITLLEAKGPSWPPTIQISMPDLVESHEELFLVVRSLVFSSRIVKVEVHKMDFTRMAWEKVDTLRDRVIFLGDDGSTSCSASDSGMKSDCIYFTMPDDRSLYIFHMDRGTISVDLPWPNVRPPWSRPFWVMPSAFPGYEDGQVKQERTQDALEGTRSKTSNRSEREDIPEVTTAENRDVVNRPWSDLPMCILELIALHLFRADFVHLTSVCRSWQSISKPSLIMNRSLSLLSVHDVPLLRNNTPWLMYFRKDDDMCNFLDPLYNETYSINLSELHGSTLCFCKDGWVFMYRGYHSVFLFNPFIQVKIQLPDLERRNYFQHIGFASTPTAPDFLVLAIEEGFYYSISVSICRRGDRYWTNYDLDNNMPFLLSYSDPVFYDGVFYISGHDGRLGLFDPERITWTVLAKPKPLKFCNCHKVAKCKQECYLVESRGELVMVLAGFSGTPIHVYRLEFSKMEWVKLETLEDQMLFVSRWTSLSSTAVRKGMENKIYFPMVRDEQSVFYSLKDRRCYPKSGFYKSEEYIYSTWIEPRWYRPSAEELNWSRPYHHSNSAV